MENQEQVTETPVEETKFIDSLTRLKQERAAKKEKKKVVKQMTQKFGDAKLAKKLVKTAVRNINTRRASGRGR